MHEPFAGQLALADHDAGPFGKRLLRQAQREHQVGALLDDSELLGKLSARVGLRRPCGQPGRRCRPGTTRTLRSPSGGHDAARAG